MPTISMIHETRRNTPPRLTGRGTAIQGMVALDKITIASIPAMLIEQMTREEMLQLIRVADVPLWQDADCDELFSQREDDLLRRMAYLARQCCQTQTQLSARIETNVDGIVEWALS